MKSRTTTGTATNTTSSSTTQTMTTTNGSVATHVTPPDQGEKMTHGSVSYATVDKSGHTVGDTTKVKTHHGNTKVKEVPGRDKATNP